MVFILIRTAGEPEGKAGIFTKSIMLSKKLPDNGDRIQKFYPVIAFFRHQCNSGWQVRPEMPVAWLPWNQAATCPVFAA
jgi:hypothetical protein